MASQPIFAPYTPLRHAAPKPNIRIAYIAGDAATAVHRGMASFPEAKRESTLEELAIAGLADELIAAGCELLSPAMYAAFLRWGETASHLNTYFEASGDSEINTRCGTVLAACAAVAALPANNMHDVLFKARLLNLEAGDCPDFGPVDGRAADGKRLPALIDGLGKDLAHLSPVIALLDQLVKTAWDYSPADLHAIAPAIGAIITRAFSGARSELSLSCPAPAPLPAAPEGYSPFMRGPLVAWRKAYAVYEAAAAELSTYERNEYQPVAKRYTEVRGDVRVPLTPELEAQLATIPIDQVQERFDDLVMAKHDASERLWALPAPSAAELATKLKIFQEADGWDLNCAGEVIDRITADARRFGHHGAFVQPDRALLSAYRGCCTETKWLSAHPDRTTEQEEPCLERLAEFEQAVAETPASTLEGVVAKLRLGFGSAQLDAWREDAIIAPKSVRFKEGLRMGCMFDRAIWSAIEDLARIGGINLAEQGA